MKKLILIVFILSMTQVSFGQDSDSFMKQIVNRLSFGAKLGANYSDFTHANFETKSTGGVAGGLVVGLKLSDHWSIQEDFLYSEHGAKVKDNFSGTEKDLKMSYLSVPILVRYSSNIGLYTELGFQSNILLADAKNTGYDKFGSQLDAGAVAGLGYQFKNSSIKGLGIGVRYYYGLTDGGAFTSTPSVNSDFKNNVIQTSVFYIF